MVRNRLSVLRTLLIVCSLTAEVVAAEWFVSPKGEPSGAGTRLSPWDLPTACAHPEVIKPGDTIWLQGGKYGEGGSTSWTSRLKGTAESPIVLRQMRGERAVLDGQLIANGHQVWFWGFEVTNTNTVRATTTTNRPPGIWVLGPGHKFINLFIHDAGHPGIMAYLQAGDGMEIHGCLMTQNGLFDTGDPRFKRWTRGAAIYTHTGDRRDWNRYITDVIAFRNFTEALNCFSTGGTVCGFHLEGNVCFDNPAMNIHMQSRNEKNPMERNAVIGNFTWSRRTDAAPYSARIGGGADNHKDVVIRDNYFVGGTAVTLGVDGWASANVTGNSVIGKGTLVLFIPQGDRFSWNNNRYFGGAEAPYLRKPGNSCAFDDWKKATGFDEHSASDSSYPAGAKVFVRKNKYEPGRGHIVVYNWDGKPSVEADLSGVLQPGANYEIRDAQNYLGQAVVRGSYDGKPVSLPMNLTEVMPAVGEVVRKPVHTAPEFAVFVVTSQETEKTEPVEEKR